MPLVIGDDILQKAGLSVGEARIEFACRLYQAGKLQKSEAAAFCGLDRIDFWFELGKRGIDAFDYSSDELDEDIRTLQRVRGQL
jgi:predicted HTH domain antitoxin